MNQTLRRFPARLAVLVLALLICPPHVEAQSGPGKIVCTTESYNPPNASTYDVQIMEADGSGAVALGLPSQNFSAAYGVALSPNRQWIAFSGYWTEGLGSIIYGVWVIKAEPLGPNNTPHLVADNAMFEPSRLSWHPSGRFIAYLGVSGGGFSEIYLAEVFTELGGFSTANPEALTGGGSDLWFAGGCCFSPEGEFLIANQYFAGSFTEPVMFRVFDELGVRAGSLVTTQLEPLISRNSGRATWVSFSPDGNELLFGHEHSPFGTYMEYGISTLSIRDGSGNITPEHPSTNPRVHIVAPTIDPVESPTWSPDGSKIAFTVKVGYPAWSGISAINADEPENPSTNRRQTLTPATFGNIRYFPSFAHPGVESVPSSAPVPLNLISWWPGENTAWDVAGIGEGAMKNSENEDPYDVGKVGRAFWFDGIDDHIQGRSGGISLAQNLSIEVWVKPLSHSAEQTIVAKGNNADSNVSYSLLLRDGKPFFRSSVGGVAHEFGANDFTVPNGVTLPLDEWSHLAFISSDSLQRLYLNGEIIGSASPVSRPTTTGPLTIGAYIDDAHPTATPGSPFDGLIDELSLYNRKLSMGEIGLIFEAGKAGKARHDPARDFSATKNSYSSSAPANLNNTRWRYGWVDGLGSPVPSYLTGGNPNLGGLFPPPAVLAGSTYVYGASPGAHLRFNRSKTDRASIGATLDNLAPRQFAFHPSVGGDNDYTVLQWVVPENGKYALSATFTGVEDSPTNTGVHLFKNGGELFAGTVNSFLGDGISTTEDVDLSEDDTVTWIVGDGAVSGLDYTGVVASAVKLDDFQPFKRPEFKGEGIFGFKLPLMDGKTVRFEAVNDDRPGNPGMTARIQYSTTPSVPGSWIDLPGGTMTPTGGVSFIHTTTTLPSGTYAFRIATTVDEVGSTFSAASETFTVYPAGPHYEVEIDVSSASDPEGASTHRGDTLTYTAKFRNSGGATVPVTDQVKVLVRIPDGTSPTTGSTAGYSIVTEGSDTFAAWPLTKPFRPVDPEPEFTIPVASSDLILSDLHNLEVGDLVELDSDGALPGGLFESTVYEVVLVTTNQFQLALPGTTTPIDITSGGTGTHKLERLWQTRTLKLAVADPTVIDEISVDDVDLGDNLVTFARITDNFSGLGGIADSDEEETTVVNPLSLIAAAPVVDVSPLKQGGTLSVDFTVKNKATSPTTGTFLRVLAPPGLTIRGGVFVTGASTPTPELTETGTALFSVGDLADASSFLAKLKNPTDIVSSFLRDQLRANTRDELSKWQGGPNPPGTLRLLVVEDLNLVLQGQSIWTAARFLLITTRQETEDLRASDPTGDRLVLLNRMLLEDAYPVELLKNTSNRGGQQILIFDIGPLGPGAERVCQARFRVQYDLNLANLPLFDFNPEENVADERPAIEFFHATASINRPSLATHESVSYTTFKKVKKPKKKGKKQKFKLVPVPGVRVVPVNYVRNGLEAELENPFGLEVLEAAPGSPKPELQVHFTQHGMGDLPEDPKIEMTSHSTAPAPGDGLTIEHRQNQILYQVTFSNVGDEIAEFVRVAVPVPTHTAYAAGPAVVRHPSGEVTPVSAPRQIDSLIIFNLPYLEKCKVIGDKKTLEFLVDVVPGTDIGTSIIQSGGSITSRDLEQGVFASRPIGDPTFEPLVAKVVDTATMVYGPPTGESGEDGIHFHRMPFVNIGGLDATNVVINFEIPEGAVVQELSYVILDPVTNRWKNVSPAGRSIGAHPVGVPSPPGTVVTFNVGTVAAGTGGSVQVRMSENSATLNTTAPGAYALEGLWSFSPSPANSDPEPSSAHERPEETTLLTGQVSISPVYDPGRSRPYAMVQGPLAAEPGAELTYLITYGDHGLPGGDEGGGGVFAQIPPGTELIGYEVIRLFPELQSAAPVLEEVLPNEAFSDSDHRSYSREFLENTNGGVAWYSSQSGKIPRNSAITVSMTVRVTTAPVNSEVSVKVTSFNSGIIRRTASFPTFIVDPNDSHENQQQRIYWSQINVKAAETLGTVDKPNPKFVALKEKVALSSRGVSITGADFVEIGSAVWFPIGGGNIVAAGGGNIVAAGGGNIVAAGGGNIVAAGGGNIVAAGGGNLVSVYVASLGVFKTGDELFAGLPGIVAGGGGNIVAAGGGNLIRFASLVGAGGSTLIGLDGASLVGLDGASVIATISANLNGTNKLILPGGAQFTLAGNAVSLAVSRVVSNDGAGVVSNDGAGIVGAGGGNLVNTMGSNFFNASNFVPGGGTNLITTGASSAYFGNEGNSVRGGAGLVPRSAGN